MKISLALLLYLFFLTPQVQSETYNWYANADINTLWSNTAYWNPSPPIGVLPNDTVINIVLPSTTLLAGITLDVSVTAPLVILNGNIVLNISIPTAISNYELYNSATVDARYPLNFDTAYMEGDGEFVFYQSGSCNSMTSIDSHVMVIAYQTLNVAKSYYYECQLSPCRPKASSGAHG